MRKIAPGRLIDIGSVCVVVAAGLYALAGLLLSDERPSGALVVEQELSSRFFAILEDGHWIGPRDATAILAVFSAYPCGYCAELHPRLEELRTKYPQHLAIVVKHLLRPRLGPELDVVLGAFCADRRGVFDSYHGAAFRLQGVVQHRQGWREIARAGGVQDMDAFETCVLSRRYLDVVNSHVAQAAALGVIGTPTIFLPSGEMLRGAPPTAMLDSIVAAQLGR